MPQARTKVGFSSISKQDCCTPPLHSIHGSILQIYEQPNQAPGEEVKDFERISAKSLSPSVSKPKPGHATLKPLHEELDFAENSRFVPVPQWLVEYANKKARACRSSAGKRFWL